MAIEIKKWLKNSFSKNKIPDWTCPSCNNGYLKIIPAEFHFEETTESKGWHSHDDWGPEFIRYRFHGTLKCKNCDDFIAFLGRGSVDWSQYYDDIGDRYYENYYDIFYPEFFKPSLKLFDVHTNCPESIKDEIEASFSFFWNDLASCANKIRISLELLMDNQKVKKTFEHAGQRKKLSLHKRIEEFKNMKPEIADFLLAIKWIGNTGSHVGKLEKIDILEAYELLDHSINLLFDKTEEKLKKITKEINKRKGVRKRK
ncbi:MAG: DUF4145 domain-containing protein [Flavobacteriales bacterium]